MRKEFPTVWIIFGILDARILTDCSPPGHLAHLLRVLFVIGPRATSLSSCPPQELSRPAPFFFFSFQCEERRQCRSYTCTAFPFLLWHSSAPPSFS
ncbi:hypothetical protein QBC38DRAFT_181947 [Podospora fimiseda]|uniref:Uncharacterized protein n=1 Tax=Podospora fimiseda TaxID=252190 RepID=A0AAN7BQW8_9PEZI|nr:hypothetical protein QBC38DRAFT_181947 [Podospora fimiseda]